MGNFSKDPNATLQASLASNYWRVRFSRESRCSTAS